MTITPRLSISKEDILSRVSSFDIFRKYCPGFKEIGVKFRSEFRTDPVPSCSITLWGNDLLYKDFGEFGSLRAIPYVMRKYGVKYYEAIEIIWKDFNLKLDNEGKHLEYPIWPINSDSISNISLHGVGNGGGRTDKSTIISIRARQWNKYDRLYWYDRYSITRKTLETFRVIPLTHYWINDRMFKADTNTYSYEFYWYYGVFRRKIYCPLNKEYRFWGNGGYPVMGEGVLPKSGDLLIITKSLKDIMCLYQAGLTAISPPSEKTFFTDAYFNKQRGRFKEIYLYMDNDATGLESAKKLSGKYNIPYIHNPIGEPKDYSDYIEKYGKLEGEKLIKQLLNE